MCGIIGITGKEPVINKIYPGLIALQHRGQDSAGVATFDQRFHLKKGNGLVANVFNEKNLQRLNGNIGIGHVRYPTLGMGSAEDAQPFLITSPFGIAAAHNGNLVNYFDLRQWLLQEQHHYINSNCDTEVILNILALELLKTIPNKFNADKLFDALKNTYRRLNGSFAVVALIAGKGLLAFRDPLGIKPLACGHNQDGYCFASESVALDLLCYNDITDVAPGQAIYIDEQGNYHMAQIFPGAPSPCIFEYVYFARPDSVIDGIGVYEARLRLGHELSEEIKKTGIKPDVVIPVPDTARGAAQTVAEGLKTKYREGLIKNRYIYRTFIMPTQNARIEAVRLKLNTIKSEIKNKKVLLVDDSIVRGNTSREIVQLVRSAGAREIYYGLFSPPLIYPCVYGIDMQTRGEFIARDRSVEEIRNSIKADALVYQTIPGLVKAVGGGDKNFCTACFSGEYPTEIPEKMMKKIEADRSAVRKPEEKNI